MGKALSTTVSVFLLWCGGAIAQYQSVELSSSVTDVQPMTGIVLWTGNHGNYDDAISLEYSYMLFNDIVGSQKGVYDWSAVESKLDAVASRQHQAIFRFRYVYPGQQTAVPDYIKALSDYHETQGSSEGRSTWFPDWTHEELQRFTLEFYTKFAERYDNDPRLAFAQVGFGLWGEYHIYDGPFVLGETFPSKAFQEHFLIHLDTTFQTTHWAISIDAADDSYSPFSGKPALKDIHFGLFDDSFMHENHDGYNTNCWNFFGLDRYQHSPAGGEFSYYSDYDQQHVLDVAGMYGVTWEQAAADFHITYMIGNDQPGYQTASRIKTASMAAGYRFEITSFQSSADSSIVTVVNNGIAPIYYDAYVAVNGLRSSASLKGLLPDASRSFHIASGGTAPTLAIESDRLVSGRRIQFDADLTGSEPVSVARASLRAGRVPSLDRIVVYDLAGRTVWTHTGASAAHRPLLLDLIAAEAGLARGVYKAVGYVNGHRLMSIPIVN